MPQCFHQEEPYHHIYKYLHCILTTNLLRLKLWLPVFRKSVSITDRFVLLGLILHHVFLTVCCRTVDSVCDTVSTKRFTVLGTARVSPPVVHNFTRLIIRAVNIAFFNGLKIVLRDLEYNFQMRITCTLGAMQTDVKISHSGYVLICSQVYQLF